MACFRRQMLAGQASDESLIAAGLLLKSRRGPTCAASEAVRAMNQGCG
jgi:hypothetical protein